MKQPSSELFELVRSLTGAERRFFQLYAKRHVIGEENNYWKLFSLIQEQKSYDEVALKQRWSIIGNPDHLPVLKQQLYKQILQGLHLFHSATDVGEQIKMALHQVDILINKGLYAHAAKLLGKQQQDIDKHELYELLPEYFRLQHKLWGKQYYQGIDKQQLTDQYTTEQKGLKLLEGLSAVRAQTEAMAHLHYQKVSSRTATDLETIDAIARQLPDLNGLPLRSQLDVLQALATAHFMKGEVKQAYHYNGKFLSLMEEKGLLSRYPDRYFSILNNYLVDSQILGHQLEVKQGIQKLRNLGQEAHFRKMPQLAVGIFRLGYQLELNLYLSQGHFEEAGRLAEEIDTGLRKFKGQVVPHNIITFRYILAYLFFGNRQWGKALDSLNQIIDMDAGNAVAEIQGFARLLKILVHYEAGHYRLVESLVEQVYRYQKQRQQLFETEKQVLAFMRKINFVEERHIHDVLFKAFLARMAQLRQNPTEQRAFNYFDFTAWANAHLQRKSLKEVWPTQH